ncbi:hypothetical protein A4A49_51764 [Nicotiana attenuata]|uniref:RNase H type-1 domain-containing protein n=1 Tax=Nicotiana attenuata TaxID=49451 RepID=A0A1J6IGR6_NICAT|nr:hypothetical protein A4A49_51764 [Nicotiana attenuata]
MQSTRIQVRWVPPPQNIYKLNIDGAHRKNSNYGGVGGIVRDSQGNWIARFSSSVVANTLLQAELTALLKGLELTFTKNLMPLVVKTDCQVPPCCNGPATSQAHIL